MVLSEPNEPLNTNCNASLMGVGVPKLFPPDSFRVPPESTRRVGDAPPSSASTADEAANHEAIFTKCADLDCDFE